MTADVERIRKAAAAYGCDCRIKKNEAGATKVIIMNHGSLMHVFSLKTALAWAEYREMVHVRIVKAQQPIIEVIQ